MNNLKTVLHQLKSEKIKERQEGLSSLRSVFARNNIVQNLDEAGDGRAWLVVFQALFTCVLNEKSALTKKSSSKNTSSNAASNRLGDAAAAVRWLTETAVQRLNKKVVKALLAHLIQTMVYQGELLAPVSLDYIKAVRCLVRWTPHLEHLDEDTWVKIIEMGWNIVLGDPVRQNLNHNEEGDGAESLDVDEDDDDDDDLFLDDEDDEEPMTPPLTQSLKRRRGPSTTPRPSTSKTKTKSQPMSIRKTRLAAARPPSLEQIEYITLIAILLRSPTAPLLSQTSPHLASSILRRLRRFIELYPTDTSMHHDYILGLSAAISQLSLNKRHDVTMFARAAWDGLVGLWGTKNKRMKEVLVGVLRVLFPFYTISENGDHLDSRFDCSDGLSKLWHLLDGEAQSRWGVDGLVLDSLRLELVPESEQDDDEDREAFVKDTFRAGWHFNAGQALAWAILELQADCAEKLFELSESVHASASGSSKSEGKRARRENPITSLLSSIQAQTSSNVRAFHIQTLLFFIDRYWSKLHVSLQNDVTSTLIQFISLDDGVIQSWTFLCFAAIAYAARSNSDLQRDALSWDPIWTHAMRRANVPTVCRAACHTAHTLLSLSNSQPATNSHAVSKRLLSSHRILLEIETLAKDLDVQGPSIPYDSVCVFLAGCLRIASQDVRLYRMQLEEKVMGWLMSCWRVDDVGGPGASDKSKMPLYMVRDVLLLLESICSLPRKSDLVCRAILPDCMIVETIVDERRTKVIRDFLLHAKLPGFRKASKRQDILTAHSAQSLVCGVGVAPMGKDLVPPRVRERRVSGFMLKSLETLVVEWEAIYDTNTHPSSEKARRSLDIVVIALSFESSLVLNGTKTTRRVVQSACKLMGLVTPLLTNLRWSSEERALIVLGLEPLISSGEPAVDDGGWEAMVPPDEGTGIKKQTLDALVSNAHSETSQRQAIRRDFQRIVWQNADIQDIIPEITSNLKNVLRTIAGQKSANDDGGHAMDVDDRDGFAPIRTTHAVTQPADTGEQMNGVLADQCVTNTCMSFLAIVPILQSFSGAPTRDKELTEVVLNCPDDKFLLIGPVFFDKIRQGILNISHNVLANFLEKFESMLKLYGYSRSEKLQLLLAQFLDSTLLHWTADAVSGSEAGEQIRSFCRWLSAALRGNKIRSWRTRDCVARFMSRYTAVDPTQAIWSKISPEEEDEEEGPEALPWAVLPSLGADPDIRVRFRAAVANASLFGLARRTGKEPTHLYAEIKEWLTTDINDYERMITRMLSLGNVMVMSSAIRRAPYFHLLEGIFYSPHFVHHIQTILTGVSERMGLASFSELFEAYASQIAFSIRQADKDILTMPSHLLGYRSRKECAEATFRTFTPTNVMAGGPSPEAIAHGQRLFVTHCKTIQISPAEGIRDCFGDIVGYQIVFWSDNELQNPGGSLVDLRSQIRARTIHMGEEAELDGHLQSNADGIVTAILRTLGDQDFTMNGAINEALKSVGGSEVALEAFAGLTRYRSLDDIELHRPNLPIYSTLTILHAFEWLGQLVRDIDMAATTYHVLHQLFADVQKTPLVNEQIRLLNSISLWVATHRVEFTEPTLLHSLIHSSVGLLSQQDLARAAQSILDWAFVLYREVAHKDSRLTDVLIRICCSAHDYSRDRVTAEMGTQLLAWIDEQALQICKIPSLRSQVSRALPAWPHRPSRELAQIYQDITSESLSAILGEARTSSNKFRLVRRFRDLAAAKTHDKEQFANTDFWHLKECIPSIENLQMEDVDAFTDLLVMHKGLIRSLGMENSSSQSILMRHRQNRKKDSQSVENFSPQRAIVQSLLAMLDGNASAQVHVAYHTLRYSMSLPSSDMLHHQSWASEYRTQLEYLQRYPRAPRTRPLRDLSELTAPDFDLNVAVDFSCWIADLTNLLSDILVPIDPFYAQLQSILQSDIAFAEQLLPLLVHTVLQAELSQTIPYKTPARTELSAYFSSVLKSDVENVSCMRCIVDVVLHLRNFQPVGSRDALAYDKWLDLDFTVLSRSAVSCGAYTTALLFLELAAEHRNSGPEDAAAEQILFEIYSHIDEPDGFYGIKTADLRQFLIKRFHHEKQWEKAFRFHGAGLEANRTNIADNDGLLRSFHAFGFDHLAIDMMQSSHMGIDAYAKSNMSYKLGWRTETWDLPDQHEGRHSGAPLYQALRAIYRERNPRTVDTIVRNALTQEMVKLRALGSESLAEIREVTQNLMCLNQITQWRGNKTESEPDSINGHMGLWATFPHIDSEFDFFDLENIMATRISLTRSAREKEEREQIGTLTAPFTRTLIEVEKQCLVRLSEAARESNQIQIALNSIVRAQALEKTPTFDVSQEFASVLWLQREQKPAVQFLKELVERDTTISSAPAHQAKKASLLARLVSFIDFPCTILTDAERKGAWTSEACLEKPTDILTHFFEPATSIIGEIADKLSQTSDSDFATVYHQCALFAEHQYLAIVKSPDTIRWKIYVDRKTQEIKQRGDQLAKTQRGSTDYNQLTQVQWKAEKTLVNDRKFLEQNSGARVSFLHQAIEMYSRCLEASDTFDDDGAIRLSSLWFANFHDLPLQNKVRLAIDRVPSRKFVFLAHQLSARLSTTTSGKIAKNQENLQALVYRMCQEHPFHSLYQVYALRSEQSESAAAQGRRQSSRHEHPSSQMDRESAAGEIFDRLRGDGTNGQRVRAVEVVCDASLQWAQHPIKTDSRYKKAKGPFPVPNGQLIRKVGNQPVPILTCHIPLDSTLRYDNCIWIAGFDTSFDTAGGANLPKITNCLGSDGKKYKQLYKGDGGDDLRQDAVMEQVFDLVNIVLNRDRETRKRKLGIRGYKVIPLASQAGVLEFVGNTIPLGNWLPLAHRRYRPGDLKPNDAHQLLKQGHLESNGDAGLLLKKFTSLAQKYQPVMRHFFTEKYKAPISWFAMRLNYIRSVATTSIVGHILGLGDRHVANILIDNGTGEVVHIDLGIAFDQGKILPVPERVPFRMTRDMVDGMGTPGTQGVFQRCAEETLRVLRDRSDVIMTVLEVFRHDPLHSWTASELKKKRAQGENDSTNTTYSSSRGFGGGIDIDMSSGTADEAADRALSSVARKLDKALSVEYTINELIAEATDPVNLATIYHGWNPQL